MGGIINKSEVVRSDDDRMGELREQLKEQLQYHVEHVKAMKEPAVFMTYIDMVDVVENDVSSDCHCVFITPQVLCAMVPGAVEDAFSNMSEDDKRSTAIAFAHLSDRMVAKANGLKPPSIVDTIRKVGSTVFTGFTDPDRKLH